MSNWGRYRHDLRGGFTALGAYLARMSQQAGRELSLVESRRELARLDRELARLHQELGEAAYEGWRQAGAMMVQTPEAQARLDAIATLSAQRETVKRDIAPEDVADLPPKEPQGNQ
jgi:hypothetical protein